ncbi:DUF952 domain-containing protein [Chloroflexota bacterium]
MIYHICTQKDWEDSQGEEVYRAESLKSEGFIHCSTFNQVERVLNTFYRGQKDLVLLAIDPTHLVSKVKWEPGLDKPDELFPHIFGSINLDAISTVIKIEQYQKGNFDYLAIK